jgi:hypothetical protein
MHTIRKVGLFLFGVIVIALGYKVNTAQAQTNIDVTRKPAAESANPSPTSDKPSAKTTTEKAKPEKAHASKYKKPKSGKAPAPHRRK